MGAISKETTVFTFYTDHVAFKTLSGPEGKRYYIEGYASTTDLDLVNDIVTKECLEDMAEQIRGRTIKIDVEHEAWKKSQNILPIGKCIDAKVDDKGLWIKCELNKHNPRFKEVWNSIKEGFLDAFSIAYQVKKKGDAIIDGAKVRILEAIKLLNIALTGNPANPEAKITAVMAKSLEAAAEPEEVEIMAEEKEKTVTEAEEKTPDDAVTVNEEAKNTTAHEDNKEPEAPAVDVKSLNAEFSELKSAVQELRKSNEELKEKLSAAMKALETPLNKSIKEEVKHLGDVDKRVTPLEIIR